MSAKPGTGGDAGQPVKPQPPGTAARGSRPLTPRAQPAPASTGSKLVHELGGTLATISLHLQMLGTDPGPASMTEHLHGSLQALRLARVQLAQVAELILKMDQGTPRRRRRSS